MPRLRTRYLFISHAWRYDEYYIRLVEWLNISPNFRWKNFSVPYDYALPNRTKKGLKEGLTRQINPAQGIIILAGMWAAHSDWIQYEIDEAVRMDKAIIGVRPRGQTRLPISIQSSADVIVNWNRDSIIRAIRGCV